MNNGSRSTYQTPHAECIEMDMEYQFMETGRPGGTTPEIIDEGDE